MIASDIVKMWCNNGSSYVKLYVKSTLSLTLFLSLFPSFNTYCLVIFLPFLVRSTFANIETLTQILLSARSSNTTTKFNVILCDWHSSWHNSVYTINLLSRCCVWMHFMFLMLIFLMLMLLLLLSFTWCSSDLMLQYNSFMLIGVYLGRDTISFPLRLLLSKLNVHVYLFCIVPIRFLISI